MCYALLQDGFKQIVIINRTQDKALQLAKHFGTHFTVVDWDAREAALEDADLLVNSTSLGMKGKDKLDISLRHLPKHAVVNDLVYAPLVTDLLVQASAHGCAVVDGLGMLIYQAVPAFSAWFGVEPQVNKHLMGDAHGGAMIVIGLTGGIGMGKTTVASQLALLGAKICSADILVHQLLASNAGVKREVGDAFPKAMIAESIDRKILGTLIFADPAKRLALEQILHPRVKQAEERFLSLQQRMNTRLAVLEIPLLFETGAQIRCDYTLVASAPDFIQKQRVMRRPNMTEEKFRAIVRAQMPEQEKRRLADGVIPTGLGKAVSFMTLSYWLEDQCVK